jgi:DNA topoisomerase-1
MELIIAEKPKAAAKIAFALGNARKKSYFGIPYYEAEVDGKKVVVASAVGHLFSLAEKAKTKGWPIFEIEWKPMHEVAKQKFAKRYIEALRHFKPQEITIACDYDTEGELIGYNVLRFIFNTINANRMKFSTLTKQDLLKAYKEKMNHIDFNQAIAGETRHLLDWIYGINLSRALMGLLEVRKILSIGRVQGPALAILVKREQEIASFKPEKYWSISLDVLQGKNSVILEFGKRVKKEELQSFAKLKGKEIELKVEKEKVNIKPLPPFNLTDLQIEAYRLFRLTPSATLAIAQELYLDGLISYPRTSSQKLPFAIGYKAILQKLAKHFAFEIAREKPVEGKATDPAHPAIFPTGEFERLEGNKKKVYELIVKRFLACFAQDATIEVKSVKAKVDGLEFSKKLKRIVERGWLKIYPYEIKEEWSDVESGKALIKNLLQEEKQTQPPPRYTPASIVKELEKRKLGTKATRAQIIETLYKRGYIKGESIKVTPLGMAVKEILEKISPLILDEALTRKFELEMDKILISEEPEKEKEKIVKEAREVIMAIASDYEKNKQGLMEIIKHGIKMHQDETKKEQELGKCKCNGALVLKRNKQGNYFVSCSNWPQCKATFSLPKGKITKGKNLCDCGWQKLRLWQGRKSFEFCFNPDCKEFWKNKIKEKDGKGEKRKQEK